MLVFDWLTKNRRYLIRKIFAVIIDWRSKYEAHATLTAKTLPGKLIVVSVVSSAFTFEASYINNDFDNPG